MGSYESRPNITPVLAIDCEMIGISDGTVFNSETDGLARVSIVNQEGACIYNEYIKPTRAVIDYREWITGITKEHLQNGRSFEEVRNEVRDILNNAILVGHDMEKDLRALNLHHPEDKKRDTSRYKRFLYDNGQKRRLRDLASEELGMIIQEEKHDSVEDAAAAMMLYLKYKSEWEANLWH